MEIRNQARLCLAISASLKLWIQYQGEYPTATCPWICLTVIDITEKKNHNVIFKPIIHIVDGW